MKKLIFLDIDGTLIDVRCNLDSINEVTRQGIAKAQQNNDVFIASGRTYCFIDPKILAYPFDGLVMCNGALVEYHGQTIYKLVIPHSANKKLIEVCKKYGWDFFIESRDCIYIKDRQDSSTVQFMKEWHMDPDKTQDTFEVEKTETYIAMINLQSEDDIPLMMSELEDYFDISRHPGRISFDLNIKGINKGSGIVALCQYMGLPIEDTIAFGDGNNDIEMIQTAGVGVAMGNAVPALKRVADVVTDPVTDNGVVTQLARMELI